MPCIVRVETQKFLSEFIEVLRDECRFLRRGCVVNIGHLDVVDTEWVSLFNNG